MISKEKFEEEWKKYCDSKGGSAVTMNIKDVAKHFVDWSYEQIVEQIIETIKDLERDIRLPMDKCKAIRKDTLCEVLDYLTSIKESN